MYKQNFKWLVFSGQLDGFEITCTFIKYNCTHIAYFLIFYIFEPQNREVIENYFKASLNFSRLKGTYLGKIHFNIIIIGASEK